MNEQSLTDLKAAMAEAEATGDYSVLDQMVRSTDTPEPTELSIRERNVPIDELEGAQAALISLKDGGEPAAIQEAKEIVQILRACYREGEIEAGRRSHGVGIITERNDS